MSDTDTLILVPRSYAREALHAEGSEDGISVIPTARIDDVYHWYRSVYDAVMPVRDVLPREASVLAMQFAADRAAPDHPLKDIMRSRSFAREAYALYEMLGAYGEPAPMLASAGGHAEAIAQVFRCYERTLAERGCTDAYADARAFFSLLADRRPAACNGITRIECRGFLSFNSLYRRFFTTLMNAWHIDLTVRVPMPAARFHALCRACGSTPDTLFLPGVRIVHDDADALALSVIDALLGEIPGDRGRLSLLYSFGAYQEAETIAETVGESLARGVPAHRIAVVGDVALLHRMIADAFAHHGVPVASRRGDAVSDHPLVRALMKLFVIVSHGTVNVDSIASLLASGMVRHAAAERYRAHTLLFGKRAFDLPVSADTGAVTAALKRRSPELGAFTGLVAAMLDHASALMDAEDFSDAVVKFRTFADLLGFPQYAEAAGDDVQSIYAAVIEAMQSLTICDTIYRGERFTIDHFRNALSETLASLTIPSGSERGGVRLLTPYDIRGAEFDHIIIAGLTEHSFAMPESTLLSDDLRRRIHHAFPELPGDDDAESLLLFCSSVLALAPGGTMTLSLTARDENGNEVLPHPFADSIVRAFEPVLADASWETRLRLDTDTPFSVPVYYRPHASPGLADARTAVDAENAVARGSSIDEAARARVSADDDLASTMGRIFTARTERALPAETLSDAARAWFTGFIAKDISVTDAESMLRCPGAFIAARLYRMGEPRIPLSGIEHTDRGAYMHRIFERFFASVRERFGDAGMVEAHRAEYRTIMNSVIEDVMRVQSALAHEHAAARAEAKRIGERFIGHEIRLFEKDAFIPGFIEHEFSHHPVSRIFIKGRIDRIDIKRENGVITGVRIIDYKSAETSMKKEDVREFRSMQPFLYLGYALDMLGIREAYASGSVSAECGYYAYAESALAGAAYKPFRDMDIMLPFYSGGADSIAERIGTVIGVIAGGTVELRPAEPSCRNCVYRSCPAKFHR